MVSSTQGKRKFWRNVITVEVLSEEYYDPGSLEQVAYDIDEGACVGNFTVTGREEVGPERMADLLISLGSEPDFFIIEEEKEGDGGDGEGAISAKPLDELGLACIEEREGYLIAQNQDGLYELWCRVGAPDEYIEEQGADRVPLLSYGGALYSWGTSEADLGVLRRQVEHELGKWEKR